MTKHQCLDHGEVAFCDGCLVDSLHHEISQLKAQLNNMEACYIKKKKERDELHAVLECVSEHFEMNDLDSCMPRVFEMIQEALRGDSD
ncbi:hypothetical protein [Acinetobacter pseudolwoffii]|uniref:hypothetical protein n=1 Tax=Acinetobacter pseudolwoffii TaxID=2053287 RepID=UPI0024698A3F|nr:hypothetical protein [Acinetobacter pseudolwoffii]MDH5819522.1 hypothetical protein [Acinetobacter pseudolwoffii]